MHQVASAKIWEAHQIPPVVVSVSRKHTRRGGNLHLFQQALQHLLRHVAVVDDADVLALLSLFQPALDAIHHRAGHVIVHVQRGVSRGFQSKRLHRGCFEQLENRRQRMANDVLQKHHPMLPVAFRKHKKPLQMSRDVNDGQLVLVLLKRQPHGEVTVSIDELRHLHFAPQHDGHKL